MTVENNRKALTNGDGLGIIIFALLQSVNFILVEVYSDCGEVLKRLKRRPC